MGGISRDVFENDSFNGLMRVLPLAGTQPEWLNLAAAAAVGQQQAQMQHAQFQQAAALQQLQAAAAGWGQGQNMYGGLWPYNFYSNPYAVAYSG